MSASDAPTEHTGEPTGAPEAASPGPEPGQPRRARFLEELPDDPRLVALAKAFERGNYAHVRAEAPGLAEGAEDEAVRAAARDLLRRIEPDPLAKYLLGLAVALLLAVTVFVYTFHAHG